MKAMTITKTLIAVLAAAAVGNTAALAASGKSKHPEHQHWHFSGPFGTFDQNALQRGYQVYETVCSNCHSLNLVAFRNLGQKQMFGDG